MKNAAIKFAGLCLATVSFSLLSSCSRHHAEAMGGDGMDEDIQARLNYETMMLADPATGKIPEAIRARELAFAATLPVQPEPEMKNGNFWQSRGPWNVGGRTRAIAIDVAHENVILAAGVSGGIYRSIDSGVTWSKITGPSQSLNISCLVQDTRAGKTNIWFAGTGELIGNSATGTSGTSIYEGNGILKSTDGGLTFTSLAATASNMPQGYRAFDIVNNIAIDQADTGETVFAATGGGGGNIYKTVNGGTTWAVIKGGGLNAIANYTDVAVSAKGVVYFTRSNDGTEGGLYRSTDGTSFTNITPAGFAGIYQRVVIGIDPNNENIVYFLGYTPGYGKKEVNFMGTVDWGSLWKYNYLNGAGTGAGASWKNLTNNLPEFGGDFGNFNTQTGYDLYVRVKPGDSKTVFLGSTNIARSTDSFSTSKNESWIGGYGVNTTRPDYQLYPNQHPDEHNMVFYPSNPNKMITSCDGGVFKCYDNTAANVVYTSLNNGYLTTQFYSVAIDHATPGNSELMGGLQDNGSYLTRSANQTDAWSMPGKSDGGFCAIANGRSDYYVSAQLGKIYHEILNSSGMPTQWARVDPLGAKKQLFVDPFLLDPNNQKRMYYVGGDRIWRNDDLTQIPMHNALDTVAVNTGWQVIPATKDSTTLISAISVSTAPANRLVYGTVGGKLYRIDSATNVNPKAINITGSAFPAGGFINCIAVSPVNADVMIVVFSNYNVQSLFYTTNGGTTWANISGNLEQNPDGSGNGPSCRWAAVMPVGSSFAYFVGTSTGLYSTDKLNATKTVWAQQDPNGIGNDIVTMIDTRPADGLVAVATHGNGVFSANVQFAYQVSGVDESGATDHVLGLDCYPNPVVSGALLNIVYTNQKPDNQTVVSIVNSQGKTLKQISAGPSGLGKQTLPIQLPELKTGVYFIRIQNGDGVSSKTFVVR